MKENDGNGDINIKYNVRELLARIDGKLDLLSTQMQQKADMSQVASVIGRVEMLERDMQEGKETVKAMLIPQFNDVVNRLALLERDMVGQSAVSKYKTWLLVTAVPAVLGAAYATVRIVQAAVQQ